MCVSQIRTKYRDVNNRFIDAPCGRCWQCLERRASQWAERLKVELRFSESAHFVTLTYNDENIPYIDIGVPTLLKSDLQKFFKRLRKLEENKVIYYAVGEYGDQTDRPHYHMIIFNASIENIDKSWNLGLTHFGKVEDGSIMYTLKYMQKKDNNYYDRQPKFALMSKGIGKGYLTSAMVKWHRDDILNRCYMPLKDGIKAPLPRYLKEKIYTKKELQEIWEYHENLENQKYDINIEQKLINNDRQNEEKARRFERKANQKRAKI